MEITHIHSIWEGTPSCQLIFFSRNLLLESTDSISFVQIELNILNWLVWRIKTYTEYCVCITEEVEKNAGIESYFLNI